MYFLFLCVNQAAPHQFRSFLFFLVWCGWWVEVPHPCRGDSVTSVHHLLSNDGALVDPCAGGARSGSGLNQTLLTGSPTVECRVTHRWFVARNFVFEAEDWHVGMLGPWVTGARTSTM